MLLSALTINQEKELQVCQGIKPIQKNSNGLIHSRLKFPIKCIDELIIKKARLTAANNEIMAEACLALR